MNTFSFKKTFLKCIKKQLRDALNDQGHIGIIYRGLTKFIVAKKGSATNLINKTIHLQTPIIRTITLLEENGVQIQSFDVSYHTNNTKIEKTWLNMSYKLMPQQMTIIQKLLYKLYTFNIYNLDNITMPNDTNLMDPESFKNNTIHALKT